MPLKADSPPLALPAVPGAAAAVEGSNNMVANPKAKRKLDNVKVVVVFLRAK
jgi:hypothetical protein